MRSNKKLITLILPILLVLASMLIVACSSSPTSTQPTATPTQVSTSPTPTSLPTGTLLYQADWSHGLAGWQASAGGKIVGGYLQMDANANFSMTVPYTPTVPDYAIEFRLQVVSVPHDGGSFLLIADRTSGKDGYKAGVDSLLEAFRK